jgi:hypothetical protein
MVGLVLGAALGVIFIAMFSPTGAELFIILFMAFLGCLTQEIRRSSLAHNKNARIRQKLQRARR